MSTATVQTKPLPVPDRLVPRTEVAGLFGVSTATIRAWEQDGKIPPAVKVGNKSFWRPGDLARFVGAESEG